MPWLHSQGLTDAVEVHVSKRSCSGMIASIDGLCISCFLHPMCVRVHPVSVQAQLCVCMIVGREEKGEGESKGVGDLVHELARDICRHAAAAIVLRRCAGAADKRPEALALGG